MAPITSINKPIDPADAREARRQIADHKGAWRNRLLADRRVSNAAKVVGCAIAEHINRASKEAKVGVRRLALIVHMTQSQVSKAVHDLADAGQLEVEWGVQGGGNNASTFKLVIDLETPDLFPFDKYQLADFVEAEKGVRPAELAGVLPVELSEPAGVRPAELAGVLKRRNRSSKKRQLEFSKRPIGVLPGEQNPGNSGNPVGTTGVTTTDADRESAATNSANTSDDAPPNQRASPEALIEQEQPPPRVDRTGPAANGGAAMAAPIDLEAEFQFVRDLFPNRDDEAGSRLAFLAVLRESSDAHQTVGLLRYGARRTAALVSDGLASGPRPKTRTLAEFIESGLWRANNAKDAIARAAAGHAGLDRPRRTGGQ
jgi:hypothetical protein